MSLVQWKASPFRAGNRYRPPQNDIWLTPEGAGDPRPSQIGWPAGSVAFVVAAYLPLVLAALWLGAGRPDSWPGDRRVRS